MTTEDTTLDRDDLSSEDRWSYYVTAFSMRDPTEGVKFSDMRMPFLKRSLPPKLDEDEAYDRYYRRIQHHDGLIVRICANNYTILYQPPTHDWFWRSSAPMHEKDADANAIRAKQDEAAKEAVAVHEKRHDRFVEKFVNNPSWARGLSKNQVDESNERFRAWIDGTLSAEESTADEEATVKEGEKTEQGEPADTEMADAEPTEA